MAPTSELAIELTTTIGRMSDVSVNDLAPYDAVYIGDPYCPLLESNILKVDGGIEFTVDTLKEVGKKVYLRTYIEPWTDQVHQMEKTIDRAVAAGIDAVEISDFGILKVVATNHPDVDVHIGGYVNLFNSSSAEVLARFNAKRIIPYYELTLEEIGEIKDNSSLSVEIQVHGKLPLGYTERCVNRPEECAAKKMCGGTCYTGQTLVRETHAMLATGRVTLGDRDICMMRHMGKLLADGYHLFRVEALFDRGDYRRKTGEIYRRHIGLLIEDETALNELSHSGLCNGFYFEQPGRDYI